jgi:hypothetical protein
LQTPLGSGLDKPVDGFLDLLLEVVHDRFPSRWWIVGRQIVGSPVRTESSPDRVRYPPAPRRTYTRFVYGVHNVTWVEYGTCTVFTMGSLQGCNR